jgi:hypothetical protein
VSDSQKKTQRRARILRLLLESKGREVPAYELAKVALQYNARIHELRKLGFAIVNRTQLVDGVRRSAFCLHISAGNTNRATHEAHGDGYSLFGDMSVQHDDRG